MSTAASREPVLVDRPAASGALVDIAGERLQLLSQRAAYWPAAGTLLMADLHLGKADALRGLGAALPVGAILDSQLAQVDAALGAVMGCSRILILGDMLHAPLGITPELVEGVGRWRATRRGLTIALVPGNHDRRLDKVAQAWGVDVLEETHREGPFEFTHVPRVTAGVYTWAGHIHPAVTLRRACDALRLPCFRIGAGCAVLPAFSRFTAGGPFERAKGDRVFAIAESHVVEV